MEILPDAAAALTEGLDTPPAASGIRELAVELWEKLSAGRILYTLILLLVCLLLIRLLMAMVKKITSRAKLDPRIARYTEKGVKMMLYLVMVLIVAGSLGIDVTSLVALVSVFGLAVSLAVQDTLSNIAGGLVVLFAKPPWATTWPRTTERGRWRKWA